MAAEYYPPRILALMAEAEACLSPLGRARFEELKAEHHGWGPRPPKAAREGLVADLGRAVRAVMAEARKDARWGGVLLLAEGMLEMARAVMRGRDSRWPCEPPRRPRRIGRRIRPPYPEPFF